MPARPRGLGHLRGWETEVALPVTGTFTTPDRGSLRADAVLTAPEDLVPVLFVEVDNHTEPAAVVAAKIDPYQRFFRRQVKNDQGRDVPLWSTLWAAMPWKTAFMSSWRALSWHELTHGRAAGCSWVTGGAARPGHQGRGPGRLRRGPPWFCDGPVPPFRQVNRTTDWAGRAHRARDNGGGMTDCEVRSFHDEAGSPTP
ncbi:replication-relaxation family protein [Streptomyces sp. NPDC058107]|uniref:replication-relaxation family protein n=1 Tax=Streptomyces sp. NPDC058107 TaxID=3346343 RepID=UPI0036E91CC4